VTAKNIDISAHATLRHNATRRPKIRFRRCLRLCAATCSLQRAPSTYGNISCIARGMHNAVGIYAADRKREETLVTYTRRVRVPRVSSILERGPPLPLDEAGASRWVAGGFGWICFYHCADCVDESVISDELIGKQSLVRGSRFLLHVFLCLENAMPPLVLVTKRFTDSKRLIIRSLFLSVVLQVDEGARGRKVHKRAKFRKGTLASGCSRFPSVS